MRKIEFQSDYFLQHYKLIYLEILASRTKFTEIFYIPSKLNLEHKINKRFKRESST